MSEGLWDGEQRYVVHCLPVEEGLPKVHRLKSEMMQRIWGGGRTTSRTRLLQLHCITSYFPSSDVVLGFFRCLFGVFFVGFYFLFFKKSFVFQSEALVAKEKH